MDFYLDILGDYGPSTALEVREKLFNVCNVSSSRNFNQTEAGPHGEIYLLQILFVHDSVSFAYVLDWFDIGVAIMNCLRADMIVQICQVNHPVGLDVILRIVQSSLRRVIENGLHLPGIFVYPYLTQ